MSLNGKANLKIDFENTAAQDAGSRSAKVQKSLLLSFLDGSGLGAASKIFADDFSVAQSVNSDTDLSGALVDQFGAALVFTAIKGIAVFAAAANPAAITVGNVTNGIVLPFGAATHSQAVAPGGFYANFNPSAAGFSIVAGTADLLRIATPATAGTYVFTLIVLGI